MAHESPRPADTEAPDPDLPQPQLMELVRPVKTSPPPLHETDLLYGGDVRPVPDPEGEPHPGFRLSHCSRHITLVYHYGCLAGLRLIFILTTDLLAPRCAPISVKIGPIPHSKCTTR
ncbi:hypothetical protein J6590_048645 [Homalodisca vitripennis]|nr:hypothetical protein J6590_048645 [Homalodisca vitripennis]